MYFEIKVEHLHALYFKGLIQQSLFKEQFLFSLTVVVGSLQKFHNNISWLFYQGEKNKSLG